MPGWMKCKLESILPGEISVISDKGDNNTFMAESEEELKSLLMKVKEGSENIGLKFKKIGLKFRKLRSWHPVPLFHGK